MERRPGKSKKQKEEEKKARSITLRAAGILTAVAGLNLATNFFKEPPRPRPVRDPYSIERVQQAPLRGSQRFERASEVYRSLFGSMTRDQVLFIDQYGASIGGVREPIMERDRKGKTRIAQRWLDAQRREICDNGLVFCDLARDIPRQINMISHLQGEAEGATYVDIVERNGTELVLPLPGVEGPQEGEGLTRIQYVNQFIGQHIDIPEQVVVDELARLAPALIGNESGYSNDVTSSAGAAMLAQIMPETREAIGYTADDLMYLRNQVPAMGKIFSLKYQEIQRVMGPQLERIEREYFDDHSEFLRQVMVPLTINAYNAGEGRMIRVLESFLDEYPTREAFEAVHGHYEGSVGYDFFFIMTQETYFDQDVDRYGKDASMYWIEIEGLAEEMQARGLY